MSKNLRTKIRMEDNKTLPKEISTGELIYNEDSQKLWVGTNEGRVELYDPNIFKDLNKWEDIMEQSVEDIQNKYLPRLVNVEINKAEKSELAIERARIDKFTKLSEGSTTGDAELQDIRVDVEGFVHPNAGDSVRSQFKSLRYGATNKNLYNTDLVIDGYLVDNKVEKPLAPYPDSILSGYLKLETNVYYTIYSNNSKICIASMLFYDKDKNPICSTRDNGKPYGKWEGLNGRVEVLRRNPSMVTLKILDNTIRYCLWYISKTSSYDYYGSHTSLKGIIDKFQVNVGSYSQSFIPFDKGDTINSLKMEIDYAIGDSETLSDSINNCVNKSVYGVLTTNLYNKSLVMDKKLISFNPYQDSLIQTYDTSILSGYLEVEEGNKYWIKTLPNIKTGALLFFNKNKEPICAIDSDAKSPYGQWKILDSEGSVNVIDKSEYSIKEITINKNSHIKYIMWYITQSTKSNYYGPHDSLNEILDSLYVHFGEYDPSLTIKESYTYGHINNSNIKRIGIMESRIEEIQNNTNSRIEEIQNNTNSRIEEIQNNTNSRIEEIQNNTNSRIEEIQKQVNDIILNTNDTLNHRKVVITKLSNKIYVRSKWREDKDIVIESSLNGSSNNSYTMEKYWEIPSTNPINDMSGSTLFKNASDDICPLNFNNSYRGGNHGDHRCWIITTSTPHNLTTKNIGEQWESKSKKYVIVKVLDSTKLVVSGISSVEFYPLESSKPVSPLTLKGNNLVFNKIEDTQFTPAINNLSIKLFTSQGIEILEDGSYTANYLDIVETHNLINPKTALEYLIKNVGKNTNSSLASNEIKGKYATISIIYRFTERGAMTVYSSYDFNESVNMNFSGITQSMSIGSYICVPNTTHDKLELLTQDSLRFTPDTFKDSNNPPARYYQYSSSSQEKGMCIGYNTSYGIGKPELRKSIDEAGFFNGKTHKMYPKCLGKIARTTENTNFSCIAYRVPLCTYSNKVPSIGWYYEGDDIYLLIDVQSTVKDTRIELPPNMLGRKITLVEKFGDIIVPDFISASGLSINVTNYGSAILKLSK